MKEAIITVKKLSKYYKVGHNVIKALDGIDLIVNRGEICSIMGPSGSGKSTLLSQLAGLEKPSKGSVYIFEKNISSMREDELACFRNENVGFVFQSFNLLNTYTALENVALPLLLKGYGRYERLKLAKKHLIMLGLKDRLLNKPSELSGGQQQRVGIARAFVSHPKIIFADEPTGNLDSITSHFVLEKMIHMARVNGITFIMVTHEKSASDLTDRIIRIIDGKVQDDNQISNNWLRGKHETQ